MKLSISAFLLSLSGLLLPLQSVSASEGTPAEEIATEEVVAKPNRLTLKKVGAAVAIIVLGAGAYKYGPSLTSKFFSENNKGAKGAKGADIEEDSDKVGRF